MVNIHELLENIGKIIVSNFSFFMWNSVDSKCSYAENFCQKIYK